VLGSSGSPSCPGKPFCVPGFGTGGSVRLWSTQSFSYGAKKKGFLSRCQTRHSPSSSSTKSMAIRHHSQPAWALGSCSCVFPTAISVVQTPFAVFPSPATSITGVPSSSDSNFPPRHWGTGRRGRVSACPLHATARRHPRYRPRCAARPPCP
jgi:hypothetical protein